MRRLQLGEIGRRRVIAAILAVFSTALVMAAQREAGIARDEVVYMRHGSRYADWWIALATGVDGTASRDKITGHFGGARPTDNNREHPPLMKTLFGLSERLFHDRLGWLSELSAYRLPTALVNGLLIALVFLFCASLWGEAAALVAALLVLLLPRAFFHAGLATFDAPIVTFWFAALVAYHRALDSRWGFLVLGLACGAALATKHNAVMLPAVLLPHYAFTIYRAAAPDGERSSWRRLWHKVRVSRPQVLLGLFVVAPLVFVLMWPWLWFDTIVHVREWMAFHLNHVHYNFEYLGVNWNAPPFPWHVPVVTTLLVAPVVTLAAAAIGASVLVDRWRRRRTDVEARAPALLLFLSAGVAMGPFLLRSTPIFGAEKHWAPAMITVCIFAGIGVVFVARVAAARILEVWSLGESRRRLADVAAVAVVATAVVVAAACETFSAHPYSLSHYNVVAGGAPGGADLGMNRQFWGISARGVLEFVNRYAPEPGQPARRVYTHDASPAWGWYRKAGLLREGLPDAGHEEVGVKRSQLALVVHELHFNRHDYMIWREYGTVQPVFVLTDRGVPIVSVYARPGTEPSGARP